MWVLLADPPCARKTLPVLVRFRLWHKQGWDILVLLRPQSDVLISCYGKPVEWTQFHWSTPLDFHSNWSYCQTESGSGWGPLVSGTFTVSVPMAQRDIFSIYLVCASSLLLRQVELLSLGHLCMLGWITELFSRNQSRPHRLTAWFHTHGMEVEQ